MIDRLLEQSGVRQLLHALKWADILQNRGSGYSTSKQRARNGFVRRLDPRFTRRQQALRSVRLGDHHGERQSKRESADHLVPPGANAARLRRVRRASLPRRERIQCAQCHHHPFDRWSQADYYGLAAMFARVGRKGGFADAEVPTNEVIYVKRRRAKSTILATASLCYRRRSAGPSSSVSRFDDPRSEASLAG